MMAAHKQPIAQYLVTKVSWRGSYRRVLAVTPSSVLTFNLETFACTANWELAEIVAVEVADERDQFVLHLEKMRLRRSRARFQCAARAHLLALLARLRLHFALPPQLSPHNVQTQRDFFRCTEFLGDGSCQSYCLQTGASAVVLHDDDGHEMDSYPYSYLKRAASTRSHPDGIVLATTYQERLFLCNHRNECLKQIYATAGEIGVMLHWEESPLNVQLLGLRNSQLVDHPAIAYFDVRKVSSDGSYFTEVQLIVQDDKLVEVHPKMCMVIARTYAKLLNVIRTDKDIDTVGLEFSEGESLVVKLESRDQFIAVLLLTCRENGYEHIMLTDCEIKKNRVYYPHPIDNSSEAAGVSMENFFLNRLLRAGRIVDEDVVADGGYQGLLRRQGISESSGWLPQKVGRRKRNKAALMGARDSFETGESMNEFLSTSIAIEELNTNIPLNEVDFFCQKQVLNDAVELLAERFASLVIMLRKFVTSVNAEIVTTLQALVKLSYSSHAALPDHMIPRVFDAMHELFMQQDFLVCYWCLKLLQCYFDPTRAELIYGQRSKILQYASSQQELLSSLTALLPAALPVSTRSSVVWLMNSDEGYSSMDPTYNSKETVQSKETRLEKEMNILHYEALFTIQFLFIYLHAKGEQQTGGDSGGCEAPNEQTVQTRQEFNKVARVALWNPDKQRRFLAEKLIGKHAFLMDAVVDTCFVRTCLSCVTLIKFLTLELEEATKQTPASADATNIILGNDIRECSDDEMDQILRQLNEFLLAHAAKIRELGERSDLSQSQRATVAPRADFNTFSDEIASSKHACSSDYTRLKNLTVPPSEPHDAGGGNSNKSDYNHGGSDGDDENEGPEEDEHDGGESGADDDVKSSVDPHPIELFHNFHISTADIPSSTSNARSETSNYADRFQPSSNSFRSPAFYFEQQTPRSATANQCDACIGCNDVCESVACFFCSEKKYQLKATFLDALLMSKGVSSASQSTANVTRTYSSCELKRHRSLRSCWVVVSDVVYDITDLLSVHPGGLQVLLQAAQQGQDCAPIIEEHPPSVLRVLNNYRLGDYYVCETRTMHP